MIPAQQLPQGFGMRLDPVGATDDQNGVIQHLEGALRLCGEVYVSGGVQKGHGQRASLQTGLFGEDGDPPGPFQAVGIQKSILMIHPAQPLQLPSLIQHGFREGGFPCVHMGQKTYTNMLFWRILWQMVHSGHLLRLSAYDCSG